MRETEKEFSDMFVLDPKHLMGRDASHRVIVETRTGKEIFNDALFPVLIITLLFLPFVACMFLLWALAGCRLRIVCKRHLVKNSNSNQDQKKG